MNSNSAHSVPLAEEIAQTESKLEELEREIKAIGEPAAHALRQRLEALKIEEHALKRNYAEAQDPQSPHPERLEKVETLLHHIEREEDSIQHDADFLNLCAPSSVSLAVKGAARLYDLGARSLRRLIPDHNPWYSPFVNRTHESITGKHGQPSPDQKT